MQNFNKKENGIDDQGRIQMSFFSHVNLLRGNNVGHSLK